MIQLGAQPSLDAAALCCLCSTTVRKTSAPPDLQRASRHAASPHRSIGLQVSASLGRCARWCPQRYLSLSKGNSMAHVLEPCVSSPAQQREPLTAAVAQLETGPALCSKSVRCNMARNRHRGLEIRNLVSTSVFDFLGTARLAISGC